MQRRSASGKCPSGYEASARRGLCRKKQSGKLKKKSKTTQKSPRRKPPRKKSPKRNMNTYVVVVVFPNTENLWDVPVEIIKASNQKEAIRKYILQDENGVPLRVVLYGSEFEFYDSKYKNFNEMVNSLKDKIDAKELTDYAPGEKNYDTFITNHIEELVKIFESYNDKEMVRVLTV